MAGKRFSQTSPLFRPVAVSSASIFPVRVGDFPNGGLLGPRRQPCGGQPSRRDTSTQSPTPYPKSSGLAGYHTVSYPDTASAQPAVTPATPRSVVVPVVSSYVSRFGAGGAPSYTNALIHRLILIGPVSA
ncbi:MAG: hypothetical protein QXH12_05700 [Candidatus Caldarchaeum sp.]